MPRMLLDGALLCWHPVDAMGYCGPFVASESLGFSELPKLTHCYRNITSFLSTSANCKENCKHCSCAFLPLSNSGKQKSKHPLLIIWQRSNNMKWWNISIYWAETCARHCAWSFRCPIYFSPNSSPMKQELLWTSLNLLLKRKRQS